MTFNILNEVAPIQSRAVRKITPKPWFNLYIEANYKIYVKSLEIKKGWQMKSCKMSPRILQATKMGKEMCYVPLEM